MTRHVVHLVYSLGCGGLEQVIVNLINHSSTYQIRHSIITLTKEQSLHAQITTETPIYCLDKQPGKDLPSHLRLAKLLRKIKPDVLHTYNFGTIEYQLVAMLCRVPKRIHCDHGLGGDDSSGKNPFRLRIRRYISHLLHHYIVVSPDLLRWVRTHVKVKPEKTAIVLNGIDIDQYTPVKKADAPWTYCTVGRADPIKNQAMLIRAYTLALEQNPAMREHTRLQIAGDGPIFDDLVALVTELNMQDSIAMLGYRNDVSQIMQSADVFVLSSLYEAMPLTALEAMACQLPVICTKVGGVSHLLSDDEAWLVESNNPEAMAKALICAYQDRTQAHEKGKNGRDKVVENYSLAAMVAAYMSLYQCDTQTQQTADSTPSSPL